MTDICLRCRSEFQHSGEIRCPKCLGFLQPKELPAAVRGEATPAPAPKSPKGVVDDSRGAA